MLHITYGSPVNHKTVAGIGVQIPTGQLTLSVPPLPLESAR